MQMEIVVEGLSIWGYGVVLLNRVLNLKSILLKLVAWLVKECVAVAAGVACVILGCFEEINRLVVINLCWLKKQDTLEPDRLDSGDPVMWTSGLVFARGEGIIGLETEYGTLHLKLLPGCAPHSISYILDLLVWHHRLGCHFYRAKSRGKSWDSEGNHIEQARYGPPFALIQGTLGAYGTVFKDIPTEACPPIRIGSVAWVESGPEFFISLANNDEWNKAYKVSGFVLPEDVGIVERLAQLPTKSEVWGNVNAAVLENRVRLHVRRIKRSAGNQNLNTNRDSSSSGSCFLGVYCQLKWTDRVI